MLSRRDVVVGVMTTSALLGCGRQPSKPKNFVLVHGAWHGGWCWEAVKKALEDSGANVLAPTLPGLGSRANELGSEMGLQTHIDDLVATIVESGLSDIILVGHSYGGMVISGAADSLAQTIDTLVYLDAVVPEDDRSMITAHPSINAQIALETEAGLRALAPDGISMMTLPPEAFGVASDHPRYDWVKANLTPHPLKTWLDPISLANEVNVPRVFIHATDPVIQQSTIPLFASEAKTSPEWSYFEIATGHDVMVTEPDKLSKILLDLGS